MYLISQGNTTEGWWERFIGPGRALDTNKFFIICCNVLGSCFGTRCIVLLRPLMLEWPLVH